MKQCCRRRDDLYNRITSLGDYRGGEWKGDTKTPMGEKAGVVCGLEVSCRHRDGKMEKHSRKDF